MQHRFAVIYGTLRKTVTLIHTLVYKDSTLARIFFIISDNMTILQYPKMIFLNIPHAEKCVNQVLPKQGTAVCPILCVKFVYCLVYENRTHYMRHPVLLRYLVALQCGETLLKGAGHPLHLHSVPLLPGAQLDATIFRGQGHSALYALQPQDFKKERERKGKLGKTVHKQRRCAELQIYNQSIRDRKQRQYTFKIYLNMYTKISAFFCAKSAFQNQRPKSLL